jgi:HSP20 family protein
MDFLKNRQMLRSLLMQGDLMNAVNGGCIAAQSAIEVDEHNFIIRIKAASLAADMFDIVLNNNDLMVYGLYKGKDPESRFAAPVVAQKFIIPDEADADQIEAVYRDGELSVNIPRKINARNNKMRKIRIKH